MSRLKIVIRIMFLVIAATAFYVLYEVHLKFVLNDYQIARIENQVIENYNEHAQEIIELAQLTENFKEFELSIPNETQVYIYINNIKDDYEQVATIRIEEDSIRLYDMNLQINDVVQLISKSVLFDTLKMPDWSVDYAGSRKSDIALTLLNDRGISNSTLDLLTKKLKKVNCIAISKMDDRIKIRYKGHRFDNFNYVVLSTSGEKSNLHKLSNNVYWEHYTFGLYCEWTNWGWI